MTANRGLWKLYHGSMPIVSTRVICQLWYMAVTYTMAVVTPQFAQWFTLYTGGAFDLYSVQSILQQLTLTEL